MKSTRLLALTFLSFFSPSLLASQEVINYQKISELIIAISTDNPEIISRFISFPIRREYPLPPVLTVEDFLITYSELFDEDLIQEISRSNPERDWESIGWRGVQFSAGTIWINSFSDYKIRAINYQTKLGKKHWENIVQTGREALPANLRDFDRPMFDFRSDYHRFRIDQIGDSFRLIRFGPEADVTYDLLLEDGTLDFDGNMGDLHIDWHYGDKVFRVQNWTQTEANRMMFGIYNAKSLDENVEASPETEEMETTKFTNH